MAFCKQMYLLMWKNWLVQRRRLCVSVTELLLPILFILFLLAARNFITPVKFGNFTNYTNESIFNDLLIPQDGIIGYTPQSKATEKLMHHVILLLKRKANIEVYNSSLEESVTVSLNGSRQQVSLRGFTSEAESLKYYAKDQEHMQHIVVFHDVSSNNDKMPKKVSFTIRPHSPGTFWKTHRTYPFFLSSGPDIKPRKYRQRAVLCLQGLVGQALARYWIADGGGNPDSIDFEIDTKIFAYPPYYTDPLAMIVRTQLPLSLVLGFMLSMVIGTKNVVEEKEKKLKESMKLMGLTSAAYWISWYLTLCVYLVPAMLMYTLLLKLPVSSNDPVLVNCDGSLFFVILLIYAHCMITFCLMVSTFVQKGNIGAVISGLLFFLFFLPFFYIFSNFQTVSRRLKLGFCLFFNTAMGLAINAIGAYETTGEGAQWNNFYSRPVDTFSISILECMITMGVSSVIHIIITWYLDNVWPGDFGVPKPYSFCFTREYWTGSEDPKAASFRSERRSSKYFERDPTGRTAGIRLQNLRKEFERRVAVSGITLNMYEGQITVLLGHNGAGKTTTMSMITGFIPPTSGTAIVNGHDIRTHIDDVRSSLGLCPQHDILFDTVTVREHFIFFSKMKGYSSPNLDAEINELAEQVGLETKLNAYSKNLSGGQKRKLSVGIALIGGSKVVVLDEPSSGMDPAARRQTWNVLQGARAGRTILLTTHYMDEADVLGDRIAIMAGGVIKCCGSSLFLKKLYGTGYHLVVVRGPNCKVEGITSTIQSVIPQATLETVVSTEVTYLLPDSESRQFAKLFRLLDNNKKSLNISSFGATATTMEEVFLKVGEPTHENDFVAKPSKTVSRITGRRSTSDSIPPENCYLTVMKRPESDIAKITEIVQGFFPDVQPMKADSKTVIYMLPSDEHTKMADLKMELENNKELLNISAVLTSTAIKMEEESSEGNLSGNKNLNANRNSGRDSAGPDFDFTGGYSKLAGLGLELSRLHGIVVKKALLTLRNRVQTLVQLVFPGLFTFLTILVSTTSPEDEQEPPLTLNILPFGRTNILYTDGQNSSSTSIALADLYKRQFCSCHNLEYFSIKNTETFDSFTSRRTTEMGTPTFVKTMIIGLEIVEASSPGKVKAIAYYNTQPYHSEAISVNYLVNALLQCALNTSFALKSAIAPLPSKPEGVQSGTTETVTNYGLNAAVFIAFAMSFVTTLFITAPIKERQSGAKHMQMMTGVSPLTYWLSTLAWDIIIFMIAGLFIPVVFALYDVESYTGDGRWALVILVLVDYGWAVLPLTYTLHFLFSTPAGGIAMVLMMSFVTGVCTVLTVDILYLPLLPTQDTARALDTVFTVLFPIYNFAYSLKKIDLNYVNTKVCSLTLSDCESHIGPCCKGACGDNCLFRESYYTSLDKPGIGIHLIAMAAQGVVFLLLVMAVEYKVIQVLWYAIFAADSDTNGGQNIQEDSDVAAERHRINSTPISTLTSTDSLVLINLYKRYKNFIAVNRVCVGIPDRECFGLLGQNGAGKSTTFKILTGDIILTGGNAYLKGFDIKNHIKQVQSNMGYCPQFDPLIDDLTARETLTMHARLRGIPEDSIGRVVESLTEFIMLSEFLDEFCGYFSGGNKRKLSTAIALIGNPPFVMLDEPSSAMDPEARRNLWTVLSKIRASGRTLVLTSHSMEECDALCTRIAIMVNGSYKCLGSPQHLKNKFGQGYTLVMKLGTLQDGEHAPSEPIISAVKTKFPGAVVFDDHEGYIHLQVPDAKVKLADLFSVMEDIKQKFHLEDYSVHQTTLEQVFLSFTKTQKTT